MASCLYVFLGSCVEKWCFEQVSLFDGFWHPKRWFWDTWSSDFCHQKLWVKRFVHLKRVKQFVREFGWNNLSLWRVCVVVLGNLNTNGFTWNVKWFYMGCKNGVTWDVKWFYMGCKNGFTWDVKWFYMGCKNGFTWVVKSFYMGCKMVLHGM